MALRAGAHSTSFALEVRANETVALVGPNGAGKTTCLHMVAGLLRPDSGRIACGEQVWFDAARGIDMPPERRRVGFVFQDYVLFPHLTVIENVRYGLGRAGRDAEGAAHWIERLDLVGVRDRRVSSLSGGERQRTALARALASAPQVLLLDEPLAALDAATRGSVRSRLRDLLREQGRPALLVTHDPVDALSLGDRIAVLEEGRLSQVGSRDQMLASPRTGFVALLAGVNLFRTELPAGSGLKAAPVGSVVFHVLADERAGPSFLSFSACEVAISQERGPGSPQNVFAGTIVEVTPLLDRVRLAVDIGVLMVAEITREASAALSIARGQRVWASVKATAIRVYG